MKIKTLLGLVFWMLIVAISCTNDSLNFENSSAELKFSRDTIFCDTIYNQVRSETYALKVYNQENKNIKIPKIRLEGGANSPYRINVDGKSGTEFTDVLLRKKDSLYIFVEIAPIAHTTEAIAEDKIIFSSPHKNQSITLFSVVQDAEFFIQSNAKPYLLNENTTWNNKKAKIIFGNLTLAEGKTLNIEEGTKIYFAKNSKLKISKNAQLHINGSLGKEVVFRGDRNDSRYDTIPMNWKGIEMDEQSVLQMNYAKILGGETGIKLHNATAKIKNSIIHTFQNYGIYAINTQLEAENLVMNNCGDANLGIVKGGNIQLTHCTLANYWKINGITPAYSLYASNQWKNNSGTIENAPLTLKITNSILYGDRENSVFFEPNSGTPFQYTISHSLLKHSNNASFSFENNPFVIQSLKNEEPLFLFKNIAKMNLRVKENSPAKKKAMPQNGKDITGKPRSSQPTIGAYE